jgi:hypothetical protein
VGFHNSAFAWMKSIFFNYYSDHIILQTFNDVIRDSLKMPKGAGKTKLDELKEEIVALFKWY